jgi:hypothetical protein
MNIQTPHVKARLLRTGNSTEFFSKLQVFIGGLDRLAAQASEQITLNLLLHPYGQAPRYNNAANII